MSACKHPHIVVWKYENEPTGLYSCAECSIKFVPITESLDLTSQLAELTKERDALRAAKDGAYLERNQCVSALSKLFPATVSRTAIEGWSEDWHGCVYIDLPTGQVSWHFHDSQTRLFAHLPSGFVKWDGHDTPEKYRRLAAIDAAKGTK